MKIRKALPLDADALASVENTQPHSAHWGKKGFLSESVSASSRIWCVHQEGEIKGFLALRFAAGFCEILNLAVLPDCCRKGLGTALMQYAFTDLEKQGVQQITLEVNVKNNPAILLYEKLGFRSVGRRSKFYNDTDDALIMKKTL